MSTVPILGVHYSVIGLFFIIYNGIARGNRRGMVRNRIGQVGGEGGDSGS
jgi:hypothetical protein